MDSSKCWDPNRATRNTIRTFCDANRMTARQRRAAASRIVCCHVRVCSEKFDVARLKRYLPAAVLPRLEIEEKLWTGELRQVTVVFLNLGLDGRKLAKINKGMVDEIQGIISSVQNAVYEYEGSLNKFLVDDKGALIVLVFGLPPVAHENDPARAVLSCLRIRQLLARLQPSMAVSFGITSGLALCGLVGSGLRREYSVLGDVVNLSARLMQHVQKEKIPGGILVDKGTAKSADAPLNRLKFEALQSIHVKGKSEVIPVFVPLYMPAAASFTMLLSNV